MEAEPRPDLDDSFAAADRGHLALVAVREVLERFVALASDELSCHVLALLNRDGCDHRQRACVADRETRGIADDPHVVGELHGRPHLQSVAAVGLAEKLPARRRDDTGRPDAGTGDELLAVFQSQRARRRLDDGRVDPHADAHLRERFRSVLA